MERRFRTAKRMVCLMVGMCSLSFPAWAWEVASAAVFVVAQGQQEAQKPKQEEPAPRDTKPPEPAAKKPVRSPILTAKLALMADPRLFPYEIEVEMNGQELELQGKVSSEEEKEAATEIVRSLEGVKSVVNKLKVDPNLKQELTRKRDETVTEYVKRRFSKSKTLEAAGFEVKTENGVVSLSGSTRFQVIILEAAQAARRVPGVQAVTVEGVRLEGEP